jgi:hypothetical protein
MSKLTEFLHKLVDATGAGHLHSDIDALAKDEEKTAEKDVESDVTGKEDTTSA